MTTIVLALAARAVPLPTPDDDLGAAERDAIAALDRCAATGPRCGVPAEVLGHAFLTRALAGAVLRGDLDAQAVANARVLAPETVRAWGDLVPAADQTAPEPWVLAFVAAPAPAAALATTTAPRAPAVVRAALGWATEDGIGLLDGRVDARASLGGGAGAWVRVDWRERHHNSRDLGRFVLPGIVTREVAVEVAVGPRWIGDGGGELLPHLGVQAYSDGVTGRSYHELVELNQIVPDPAVVGAGMRLGALGFQPLDARRRLGIHGFGDLGVGWSQNLARPISPGRESFEGTPAVQDDPLDLDARLEAALEWRPALAMSIGLGPTVRVAWSLHDSDTVVAAGAVATLGWTL